jgi:hypothetical protein
MDKMSAQRHWLRRFGGQIADQCGSARFLGESPQVLLTRLRK